MRGKSQPLEDTGSAEGVAVVGPWYIIYKGCGEIRGIEELVTQKSIPGQGSGSAVNRKATVISL